MNKANKQIYPVLSLKDFNIEEYIKKQDPAMWTKYSQKGRRKIKFVYCSLPLVPKTELIKHL